MRSGCRNGQRSARLPPFLTFVTLTLAHFVAHAVVIYPSTNIAVQDAEDPGAAGRSWRKLPFLYVSSQKPLVVALACRWFAFFPACFASSPPFLRPSPVYRPAAMMRLRGAAARPVSGGPNPGSKRFFPARSSNLAGRIGWPFCGLSFWPRASPTPEGKTGEERQLEKAKKKITATRSKNRINC